MRLRILLSVGVVIGAFLLIQKIGMKGEGGLSPELLQVAARISEEIDADQRVVVIELGTPLLGGGGVASEEFEKALHLQGIQIIEHESLAISEDELPRLGYGTLPEGMVSDYFQVLERHADAPCILSLIGAPEAQFFGNRRRPSGQKLILVNSFGIGMADVRQLLRTRIVDLAFISLGPDATSGLEPLTVENLPPGE